MSSLQFTGEDGTFTLTSPENVSYLYLPLAGEKGLKSAITPTLGGDSKIDQGTFLLQPACAQDLHASRSTRNFWVCTEDGTWSATGVSAEQEAARFTAEQENSCLMAGLLWQSVRRSSVRLGLEAELTSFVPVQENVEVLSVRITNIGARTQKVTGIAAVPIFGRGADHIRDHRDVTSMLHRIRTVPQGVVVKPTLAFDERGHRENGTLYYVLGFTGDGTAPEAFFPTVDSFIGEGGTFLHPRAVYERHDGVPAGVAVNGREAMGGFRFPGKELLPGESATYVVLMGITEEEGDIERISRTLGNQEAVQAALEQVKRFWQQQGNLRCRTGSRDFDRLMRWVGIQPVLRRLFGCSFLPHHDYGRGGRGWRDLWQDCLSLLLMDPDGTGDRIRVNFGGVRVDGTNATIIGAGDGSFIADRNGIARVWMDHAFWPLMTLKLYIDQTGDRTILDARVPYFKDAQSMRAAQRDEAWSEADGSCQRTMDGGIYLGTVLEHLLVENLTAFYEVGEHGICRLRDADWNDALDMAPHRGESVAFTCAYAGNLRDLAQLLRERKERVEIFEELMDLLIPGPEAWERPEGKQRTLEQYLLHCCHTVSGKRVPVETGPLAATLEAMSDFLMSLLRRQEWISAGPDEGWFNSYYDDHGRPVEGVTDHGVRMMLTGQVFAVMSGTATEEQTAAITRSADRYLFRKELGGYRLNTDFREQKTDLGRMFGFAYGEKENGSVFSHMAVMYANALYRRGFIREGNRAMQTLADAALNFPVSRIYPGIPEYFNGDGRGVYHYLTGAGSWYMLTLVTQVFGVRGRRGDLVLEPKLLPEQFDDSGQASISLPFAGRSLQVVYVRDVQTEADNSPVRAATLNGSSVQTALSIPVENGKAILRRETLLNLPEGEYTITAELGRSPEDSRAGGPW